MPDLGAIVKAYDVRGTVPDQLNADVAYALGVGFARFTAAPRILVAHAMRPSGPELVAAFVRGALEQGVEVAELVLASTDPTQEEHAKCQEQYRLIGTKIGRNLHRPDSGRNILGALAQLRKST